MSRRCRRNPSHVSLRCPLLQPSLAGIKPAGKFQFEWHGYFVANRLKYAAGKPVFNRITGMRDGWGKSHD